MSPHPATESTATLIREWVAMVDRAAGPKPMALPYLAAGDPEVLARITLRTLHEGILADSMGLARLALIVGATAEHEAGDSDRGQGWGTEAQVRVGLALIGCAMRATGWFSLAHAPDGDARVAMALSPRLALSVPPGAMDAACHCLGTEAPNAESWRPTVRALAPPFGVIRTFMGGRSVTVALAEAVDADLPGGGIELGRAAALWRA